MKYLAISVALFLVSALLAVLIIEGLVYGDEMDRKRMRALSDPAEGNRVARLMTYHGVDTAFQRDGEWFFERDGKRCRLEKAGEKHGATRAKPQARQ